MPKSNSQQKSTPDARTRHQQVGAKRRGAGGIAPGESAPKPLAAWAAEAGEGTKRRHNQIHAFVEYTKTAQRRARSI